MSRWGPSSGTNRFTPNLLSYGRPHLPRMSSAPNLSLALRQGGAFFSASTCSGRGKPILPRPVPMRTLFSSRIRGHLWGYCACNVVSLHYVPHQNLGRHRYPSRTLRRYSVPDARKTDSAYLCQRPFRPGVPALSSGAPFPRDVPKGPLPLPAETPAHRFTATRKFETLLEA